MATGGPAGGSGGSVAPSAAATRVNVIDPHILQMMRDVMSAQESAPRLKVGPGAGGGGGGGGGADGSFTGQTGGIGQSPSAVQNCVISPQANTGDGGAGGIGGASGQYSGGGGGGGGGGCGGVMVLITTAASTTGSLSVAGGEGGAVGSSVSGQA